VAGRRTQVATRPKRVSDLLRCMSNPTIQKEGPTTWVDTSEPCGPAYTACASACENSGQGRAAAQDADERLRVLKPGHAAANGRPGLILC
jgi:hypothetical protein